MNVDRVMIKKTLKLGNGVVVMPGTIFPNPEFPEIPREVRLEINLQRGVVEVLKLSQSVTRPPKSGTEDVQPAEATPSTPKVERAKKTAKLEVKTEPDQPNEVPTPPESVVVEVVEAQTADSEAPASAAKSTGGKRVRKPITTK